MSFESTNGDGGGSESYLESLSDLLVGMLFIFIIILMVFALNYRVAEQQQQTVTKHLSDSADQRSSLLKDLQERLKKSGIPVSIDPLNGVMHLPESLLFDSGSAEFRGGGEAALAVLGRELSRELPCYAFGKRPSYCPVDSHAIIDTLLIEGHTDNIPIQTSAFADNWDLSAARSKVTFEALIHAAPGLGQITNERKQQLISISAYGSTRPVASNETKDGRSKNRRIDLRFVIGAPRVVNAADPSDLKN
jgi:chemotaxis protein MotB